MMRCFGISMRHLTYTKGYRTIKDLIKTKAGLKGKISKIMNIS